MKKAVKKLFQKIGLDIRRVAPVQTEAAPSQTTKRTKDLAYYRTKTGNYYLPVDAHGDVLANTIKADQIFDEQIVKEAALHIKPGTTVLDIGANFGQMSVQFSKLAGKAGKVYSFDADDFIFDILKKNIAANKTAESAEIIPIFGAVSNKAGETFYFPEQDFVEFATYGSYGVDYTGTKGREVKSVTIDSLDIQEPISFVKVDIQGGDLEALQGAVNTINKNRMPIIFEYEFLFEERFNLSFQKYVDFVASINYEFRKVIYGSNYLIMPKQ